MNIEQKIFATLFVLGDVASIADIAKYTDLSKEDIESSLLSIKDKISLLGLETVRSTEGIQLMTVKDAKDIIEKIRREELSSDLSPAALQVMTVIAYMPGASRSDISYVRGAQSSASVRNLIMRGLVYRRDEACYITNEALSHLGVSTNQDLPEYDRLHTEFINKLSESLKHE